MSGHYYCPQCGNAALVTFDDKLFGCSRCGYTYFHNTAAAASAVIWQAGRIALITRARPPGEGLLDLPGGFVDGDESLEDAVLREVEEEIGLVLTAPRFLFSVPNRYSFHNINYKTVDAFFGFEIAHTPAFEPNDEAAALSWIAPADVSRDALAFHSARVALDRLLAAG